MDLFHNNLICLFIIFFGCQWVFLLHYTTDWLEDLEYTGKLIPPSLYLSLYPSMWAGGQVSNKLQKVALGTITNEECQEMYRAQYTITENMLCTYTEAKDACQVRRVMQCSLKEYEYTVRFILILLIKGKLMVPH